MADQRAQPFAVEVVEDGKVIVVSFSGELDFATAPEMREALLLDGLAGALEVSVDLTPVTFLDSGALGIVVAACRRVRDSGGSFSVTCGDGLVRRVLEISGLIEYLHVEMPPKALD